MGVMSLKNILKRFLGTKALKQSGIGELTLSLIPKMAVMTVVCLCISLILTRDWRDITGFAVGLVYAVFCLVYLARTCGEAASCGDIRRAKAMMVRCYVLRFFGLFILGAVSLWFEFMSFVGILLPQLFPKILLSVSQHLRKKD